MSSEKLLPKPTLNFPLIVDPNITSSDKVIINGPNSNLEPSIVTSLELSYLSGATSNIQDQINTAIAGGFKYNSTNRDPTLTDDSSGRYTRCSLWVNTIDNAAFICVDESVGSAVWDVITWDQPLNTNDDVVFNKVTASDGLDVVTGDTSVVNFKPESQGSSGNFLKSDGVGGVYWGSSSNPSSGIVYNGTLPSVIGSHVKLNIIDGTTVNESKLVESTTNLNMGGLNITNAGTISAIGLNLNSTKITNLLNPIDLQDGATKDYVDTSTESITITSVGTGSSILSSTTNPNFSTKSLSIATRTTGLSLVSTGTDIILENTAPSTLITLTSSGGESLVGSGINPLLTIKGLTAGSNLSIVSGVNSLTLNTLTPTQEYGSLAYANTTTTDFIGNRYYQLYSNYAGTISDIVLYSVRFGVLSQIRVGIYRGTLSTNDAVLVGSSSIINVNTVGILDIPILQIGAQNLSFAKNEPFIISIAISGAEPSSIFLASLSNSLSTYSYLSIPNTVSGFPSIPQSLSSVSYAFLVMRIQFI